MFKDHILILSSSPNFLLSYVMQVGVFLCVFLRERLLVHCSDIRTAVTATGIMDIMGNKGGVVIRMKLYHRY